MKDLRNIWDNWTLIAEFDDSNSEISIWVWGIDPGGFFETTGGSGALLWVNDIQNDEAHAFGYNGSNDVVVTVAFEGDNNGTYTSVYTYNPFGRPILSEGKYARKNPFRFSTKFHDSEVENGGMLYFGYRFYTVNHGKWQTRDPIHEASSLNLYDYVGNNGICYIDYLGLQRLRPDGVWDPKAPIYPELPDDDPNYTYPEKTPVKPTIAVTSNDYGDIYDKNDYISPYMEMGNPSATFSDLVSLIMQKQRLNGCCTKEIAIVGHGDGRNLYLMSWDPEKYATPPWFTPEIVNQRRSKDPLTARIIDGNNATDLFKHLANQVDLCDDCHIYLNFGSSLN